MRERDRGSAVRGALGAVSVVAVLIGALVWWNGRVAPVPAVFSEPMTLTGAEARADAEGRVVVAVVTADWCGACQAYKRGALVDPRVTAWIGAHAVPVMIDATKPGNPDALALGAQAIPATFVVRDGEVVAKRVGAMSADDLMVVLETSGAG